MPADRDWVAELMAPEHCQLALTDLRSLLLKGLAHYFPRSSAAHGWIEDFTQQALLRIHANCRSFRGDSSFERWALAIGRRIGYTELRRAHWHDRSLDQLLASRRHPAHVSPENFELRSLYSSLHQAIQHTLTPRQRVAILAELAGFSSVEAALTLTTRPSTVYKLSFDARIRLHRALIKLGWSALDVCHSLECSSRPPYRSLPVRKRILKASGTYTNWPS